jgi:predicted nucleic acid-binding protein
VSYLLDTCLLSELWRPAPHPGVVAWLAAVSEDDLHLSALTLGELRRGLAQLPPGKKRDRLARDQQLLRNRFSDRVLPVSTEVAERWGELSAEARRAGRDLHVVDGLLAATALVAGLTLVTRNVADFSVTQVPLLDPWGG